MPKDQMQDIVADIQKIFKASPQAAAIGSDAKAIAAEIQKTALK
jgi:hypothetical protein